MVSITLRSMLFVAAAWSVSGATAQSVAQVAPFQTLGDLTFAEGRPTQATAQALRDELLYQRATQTYLWALPLINSLGMQVGSEKAFGAGYNVLPIWKERIDARTLMPTPASDVIVSIGYLDLSQDGPLVIEAPAGLEGILLDFWQHPIHVEQSSFAGDIGASGPDGGKGGKLLLLPPGFRAPVPNGYYVYRSETHRVLVMLRAFYEDPAHLSSAVKTLEHVKIHPLDSEKTPKAMQFPDASGVPVNMLPISDGSVFDQLKRLGDSEGETLSGPQWLGMLAAIGVMQGQPFQPDAHARELLDRAAKTGYRMSRILGFAAGADADALQVYPERHWVNLLNNLTAPRPDLGADFRNVKGGFVDLNARSGFFTDYSITPGLTTRVPGNRVVALVAFTDAQGTPLSGASSYRLNLPANVPAANLWSVTVYDAENSSGLANGQPFPALGSRDKLTQNPDGSTDIYFGPKRPENKHRNWIATVPDKGYFAILRLYGPTAAATQKNWKPGDIEQAP